MGCIVNGPGEMADADFGYVGGSPGKIDLYVGKVSAVLSIITTFELYCKVMSCCNHYMHQRTFTGFAALT